MAAKKTGLGRGLDALLGTSGGQPAAVPARPAAVQSQPERPDGLRELPLDLLQPGAYQPRRDMHKETLEDLAESIRSQGVLAPISVRPLKGAGPVRYEIIAGERRWRASQLAGLAAIPAIVRDVNDEQAAAIALIENLQREDLNPLEQAEGLVRLIDEFDLTHQEAGRAVGKSRAAVSNLIRLLELCPEAREMLAAGKLDMGHARALLALSGSRSQAEAANAVVSGDLSVRQTEALVKRMQAGDSGRRKKQAPAVDRDIQRLQDDLGDKLGARVAIRHTARGSGQLVINYNTPDELEGILQHIK